MCLLFTVNVVSAAVKGVVSGALGGMFTEQTKGVTCACQVAEKNESKIFEEGGKLVEKAVDLVGSLLETVIEKRTKTMQTDGLNIEEEAIIIDRSVSYFSQLLCIVTEQKANLSIWEKFSIWLLNFFCFIKVIMCRNKYFPTIWKIQFFHTFTFPSQED